MRRASRCAEHLVDRGAGAAVLLGHGVRVGVEGDLDVGVTQAFLHHLVVADDDAPDRLRRVP